MIAFKLVEGADRVGVVVDGSRPRGQQPPCPCWSCFVPWVFQTPAIANSAYGAVSSCGLCLSASIGRMNSAVCTVPSETMPPRHQLYCISPDGGLGLGHPEFSISF